MLKPCMLKERLRKGGDAATEYQYLKKYSPTQQTPNPEAQFPLSSPPLFVHSAAV